MAVSDPYRERPARSEPWRYRCPDCGSVTIKTLTGKERTAGKQYSGFGEGRYASERDRAMRFRCHHCQERKPVVVDMRAGKEVRRI